VVIAGLPGSGKTTLLRGLLPAAGPGVVGLDNELVAERLVRAGVRLPYRLVRPWVHGWHRWRVLRTIAGPVPVVVLTDPWTRAGWRRAVLVAARWAGRPVHLVVLDASPAAAEAGQASRGRSLSARAMRRHTTRWAEVLGSAGLPDPHAGVRRVTVVDRSGAGRLLLDDLVRPPA
jgi:predicted kinase